MATPATKLRVTSGSSYCQIKSNNDTHGCVTDGAYDYGSNEACTIEVMHDGVLSADGLFSTQDRTHVYGTPDTYVDGDVLSINGQNYSGSIARVDDNGNLLPAALWGWTQEEACRPVGSRINNDQQLCQLFTGVVVARGSTITWNSGDAESRDDESRVRRGWTICLGSTYASDR